jgi:hypothetical protein
VTAGPPRVALSRERPAKALCHALWAVTLGLALVLGAVAAPGPGRHSAGEVVPVASRTGSLPSTAAPAGPGVDRRWVRGDVSANRAAFLACLRAAGGDCWDDPDGQMAPGWVAFVLVVCLLAGWVGAGFLGRALLRVTAERIEDPDIREGARTIGGWALIPVVAVGWPLVFDNLAFGYALPRIGLDVNGILGTVAYPLYLAFLVLGLLTMIGYPVFAWGVARATTVYPRAGRLALYVVVMLALVGWRLVRLRFPAAASGLPEARTPWLDDALHTWSLQWPLAVLWEVLRFFSTTPGLALLLVLAGLAVALPAGRRTAPRISGLAHGTAVNAGTLIAGTLLAATIGVVLVAALALLALFVVITFVYYALALAAAAAVMSWVSKQ